MLVGDSGAGKTNIMSRYTKNYFNTNTKTTMGVEMDSKMVHVDDKIVRAEIWDTGMPCIQVSNVV